MPLALVIMTLVKFGNVISLSLGGKQNTGVEEGSVRYQRDVSRSFVERRVRRSK